MEYARLGRLGLWVSRLGLGTMNFGSRNEEPACHAIMDESLEQGINFIDSAIGYGKRKYEGYAEQMVGRWFAQAPGRREKVVMATKCYGVTGDGPNDKNLSAWHIRDACEGSLRRLQTDHIDLYQMHHIDRDTPWEEIWQAMELLVKQGKVLYVGSSNFAAWHIARANETAANRNFLGLVSEQSKYSLDCRTVELEVLPACLSYGLGVIPWSPLGGGLLAGVFEGGSVVRRAEESLKRRIEKLRPRLEAWEAFCKQLGEKPAHVALAWLLAQPAVTAPIIGPRTPEQVADATRAVQLKLTPESLKKIDEIWPGPGGTAPEAYAW